MAAGVPITQVRGTGRLLAPHRHTNHLSNGLLEGINSLIQAAKARARGYRNKNKMITIVYLTAAKLQLPSLTSPTPAYMSSH